MKKNYIYLIPFMFTTIILVVFLFIGNEFFEKSKKIFSTNQFIIYKIQKFDSEEKSVSDFYYQKPLDRKNATAQFLFKIPTSFTPLTSIENGQIIYYTVKKNKMDFLMLDLTKPEIPSSYLFSIPRKNTHPLTVNKIIYQSNKKNVLVAITELNSDISAGESKNISTIYFYSLQNQSLTNLPELISQQDRLDLLGIYENKLLIKRFASEICREYVKILQLDTMEEMTLVESTDVQPTCLSQLSLSGSGRFLLIGQDGGVAAKNKTIKELTSVYDLKETKYVPVPSSAAPTAEYIENLDTSRSIWSRDEKSLIMLRGKSSYTTLDPVTLREDVYLDVSADHFILGAPEWQDQKGGLIVKALVAVGPEPTSAPFSEKLLGVDSEGYFEIASSEPDYPLAFVGVVE